MENKKLKVTIGLGVLAILAAACASQIPVTNTPVSEDALPSEEPSVIVQQEDVASSDLPEACDDPFEGQSVRFAAGYWPDTDFCQHSVDYSEIFSGGPPPDGIPAIDEPKFESVEAADSWLEAEWPVMIFEKNGDVRAYPLTILIYHEIVNDVVGGEPVSLTFCPLCNATIAFDRTLPDGTVLDFGTTGNLRNSDLVMYDRQTQSWWQQFTGEAIVGELTGTQLEFLPSQIIAWNEFKENHPDGTVLSRETGHARPYGSNPYSGYDNINSSPWFRLPGDDGRLPPMERVVAIMLGDVDVAYPFADLREAGVVNDEVAGIPVVVFWQAGTSSTFGNDGDDVGSAGVFQRELEGQVLTFMVEGPGFTDLETGSQWNILGQATAGPLEGSQLEKVVSGDHFWFAWATFKPETIIWQPA